MTFAEYQKKALTTAINDPDPLMAKTIWAMGVAGEAGEVIEKWKKIVAYQAGQISQADLEDLASELGDVVWYVSVFADQLGLKLEDILKLNLAKLQSRKARGVIKGAGNNR